MADSRKRGCSTTLKEGATKKASSPKKSKSFAWRDHDVSALLAIMKEETILLNLEQRKDTEGKEKCM